MGQIFLSISDLSMATLILACQIQSPWMSGAADVRFFQIYLHTGHGQNDLNSFSPTRHFTIFDRDTSISCFCQSIRRLERTVPNHNGHSYPILIVLDVVAALEFRFEAVLISVRGANAITATTAKLLRSEVGEFIHYIDRACRTVPVRQIQLQYQRKWRRRSRPNDW